MILSRRWVITNQICQSWPLFDKEHILCLQIKETKNLSQKGKFFRQRRKVLAQYKPFEDAIAGCLSGPGDFDCDVYDYAEDDYVDISVHAKVKGEEEDEKKDTTETDAAAVDPRDVEVDDISE